MTYFALIRGINVGGKNKLKMADLRSALEKFGFSNLKTYVQSGNIVFEFKKTSPGKLGEMIKSLLKNEFDLEVPVLVKTADNLMEIVKSNPFEKKGFDLIKSHVSFFSKKPAPKSIEDCLSISSGEDKILFKNDVAYIYCPNGYARTKLSNNLLEKCLNVTATTRNWKTVTSLYDLATY